MNRMARGSTNHARNCQSPRAQQGSGAVPGSLEVVASNRVEAGVSDIMSQAREGTRRERVGISAVLSERKTGPIMSAGFGRRALRKRSNDRSAIPKRAQRSKLAFHQELLAGECRGGLVRLA